MNEKLSPSAQKVQAALEKIGLPCQVIELPDSTRSSLEAANAIGCTLGQIVKSLVFRTKPSGKAVLILASGTNRVDEKRIETYLGEMLEKADADFVREQTGFAIGGIPPLGHLNPLTTLIDQDLLQYEEVWAAAGTPHAVFRLAPSDLQRMTSGMITSIKK